MLVTAALLAPKLVLELQDNVRCSQLVLGELESMDVTSFNTGYETNLYTRLTRFAEGLEAGRQYMVAEQELTATPEVENRLFSDKGLYQNSFYIWLDEGFIPDQMLIYELEYCKQYVIYGDDFAEGVNFILWYLELRGEAGRPVLKLLLDAETGEMYAISVNQTEDNLFPGESWLYDMALNDLIGDSDIDLLELWYAIGYYFGEQEEIMRLLEEYGNEIWQLGLVTETENSAQAYSVDGYIEKNGVLSAEETERMTMLGTLTEKMKWEVGEDGNRMDFYLPYGREGIMGETSELCFRLEADYLMVIEGKGGVFFRPKNFVVGFPEIYERIPEFME